MIRSRIQPLQHPPRIILENLENLHSIETRSHPSIACFAKRTRDGQSRAELRDNEAGAYNKRTIGDEPSRDIRRIPPNAGYLHHPVLYHRRRNPWVSPVIVIEPTPAGRVVPPQGSKKRRTIFALIGEYLSGTRTVESFPRNRGSNTGRFIGRFSLSLSFLPPRSNLARSQ